ncbi:MAG TPA: ImmA/IrrE family metallo-endopeptidase [Polyangiaceae bacterium]
MTARPPRSARGLASPWLDPVAAAAALHARFGIREPCELAIEEMAWHCGATVLWRDAGSADARVVRSGDRAYLAIGKRARGTPRARFSIAHELAHLLLHADFDAIARIHGGARETRREFKVEYDADRFASELLVPAFLARRRCEATLRPTFDDVAELAREYGVSLTVAAKRWPKLSSAPCASFEARRGVLRNVVRSSSFRGDAIGGRELREGMLAREILEQGDAVDGIRRRVHDRRWGSGWLGTPIVEECVRVADGVVLGWLWHEVIEAVA